VQNGSAASELCCRCASLHHGLGLWPAAYKDVARSFVQPSRSSPRTSSSRPPQVCRRARSRQGQGLAVCANAPILDRFCARRTNSRCGSGRRNGLPGRTKKLRDENMDRTLGVPPLTKIAPYKGFGDRPITTVEPGSGPVSESRQGKNPRENRRKRVPRGLWRFVVSARCNAGRFGRQGSVPERLNIAECSTRMRRWRAASGENLLQ
jgi:hypothetical protein